MSKSTVKMLRTFRILLIVVFAFSTLTALGTGSLTAPLFPALVVFLLTGRGPAVVRFLVKKARKQITKMSKKAARKSTRKPARKPVTTAA